MFPSLFCSLAKPFWQKKPEVRQEQHDPSLAIISWQASWHIKAGIILTVISLVLGYIMANYTPASFPYIDTFTTVFSVFNNW